MRGLIALLLFSLIFALAKGQSPVLAPWIIILSSNGQEVTMYFGEYGDVPVPGDYDGDGVTDLAVWRRYRDISYKGTTSKWIVHQSSSDAVKEVNFGQATELHKDVPVQADYDGDGKTDMAYLNVASNTWTIKRSSDNQTETRSFDPTPSDAGNNDFAFAYYGYWFKWSYQPAPADYDGDGKADMAAFQPSSAKWKYQRSSDNQLSSHTFGKPGDSNGIYDIPTPADYDGDGKADLSIWRPLTKNWIVNNLPNRKLGDGMEIPVPGDYDGDGKADMALFVQEPTVDFEYMGDINIDHWNYDYQASIIKDNGKYKMWWCGASPRGYLDAIWYSESSNPASGYSEPKLVKEGDCYVSVIKVPSAIHSTFSGCGQDSVYLMYTEGENRIYYFNTDGTVDRTRWERHPYGNKVLLYYSCDAYNWTKYGQVISLSSPIVGNAYGTGQPKVRYIDNKIYLTYYQQQDASIGGNSRLAVSTDGVNFTKKGQAAYTVGGRVSYLKDLNTFTAINTGNSKHISNLIQPGGYERVHFSKDIAGMDSWVPVGQYAHSADLISAPKNDLPELGKNLIENDGFEAPNVYGSYLKSLTHDAVNGTVAIDTSFSRGDQRASLKFTANNSPSFTIPHTDDFEATIDSGAAGVTYEFSIWMKTAGENIKTKAYIFCLDENANAFWGAGGPSPSGVFSFTPGTATGEWSELTHRHTCPTGSRYVTVRLNNDAYSTTPQPSDPTIWFDDAKLIRLPMPEDQYCTQGSEFLTNSQGIIEGNSTYFYAGHWNQKDICGHSSGDFSIKNADMYVMKTTFNYDQQTGCEGGMFRKCHVGQCEAIQRRDCSGNAWGNWKSCDVNDQQKPTIANCPKDTTLYLKANNCQAAYSWTAPVANDNCAARISTDKDPGSLFTLGVNQVTYTAIDSSGNSNTCTFAVTVKDTISPTITCPKDTMLVTIDSTIMVNYPPPRATDNCSVSSTTLLSGLSSGSEFPPGTTTQVFKVTDKSGNQQTCTFNITVTKPTTINGLNELTNQLICYPNPNTGTFFISANAIFKEPINIYLYTVEGKIIFHRQWLTDNTEQVEINIPGQRGYYRLELVTEKGVLRSKIIKQ